MSALLHLVSVGQWRPGDCVPPGPEGFVHLSTPEQVHLPANRLYAGCAELQLLCIDPAMLTDEVRWEPGVPSDPASMRFPHLYGPLPTTAVIGALDYLPNADGVFLPPPLPPGW